MGLGRKIWENGEKTTISGHFQGVVPVPNRVVPVHKCSVNWYRYRIFGTGTQCFVSDQF